MANELHEPLNKATAAKQLSDALHDGLNLIQTDPETSKQNHDLKSVLKSRLSHYYSSRGEEWVQENVKTVRDAELLTAREALGVVERMQKLLTIEDDTIVPAIGTRDLSQIRTIMSLVFKWGTEPLLNHIKEAWPTQSSISVASSSSRAVDFSDVSKNYSLLSELTLRTLGLLLPGGVHAKLPKSLITTTLLNQHLVDVLRPSLALGWLPKSLDTESMPVVDTIRPLIMRLLSILPTVQTISSLGNIISSSPPPSLHSYRACTTLLSRQILRPDGVQGLFGAVFGEEETSGGTVAVEKLEHVSTVLNAVPSNTKPQIYFEHVIPRIIMLLSDKSPSAYRRMAAFTISRMLREGDGPLLHSVRKSIILGLLHEPLQNIQGKIDGLELQQLERLPPKNKIHLRPDVALEMLLALLSNADPSPSFISELVSPVLSPLYSLLCHLNKIKTSDPHLKESLRSVLVTWGKIVTGSEGLETLWSIVKGGRKEGWKVDLEGHIYLLPETEQLSSLSLLTPDRLPEDLDLDDPGFDANIFDLYPDPLHFVKLLKDIDRGDISSDLFVRLLEAYRGEKSHSNGDSLRIMLYLQIIMQMQKHLSEGTTSNILKRPQQMLSFINHVLETANNPKSLEPRQAEGSKLEERLRIVSLISDTKNDTTDEGDSDDDVLDSENILPDDELVETALNLLLSVLEADEDLSARTMPILNDVFSLLEPLSKDGSSAIRPLAREARLVMTARLASTSRPQNVKRKPAEESAQEIYQKALKLLQDPILPVRAHGLLLLRQLVTSPKVGGTEQGVRELDPALVPAILSIFLQSVQDEDSYIFLNSVQGLAAMVDGLGREVLKGLIDEYIGKLEGLGASVLSQQEVDIKTRIGEALGMVIKRCGDALGIYTDLLIPPFFKLVRARDIPTTLRTSALSLLADCVNTYPLAMLVYAEDLAGAMVDLLQVENVPAKHDAPGNNSKEGTMEQEKGSAEKCAPGKPQEQPGTMDDAPTSKATKFPPLRRAALHLLGLLAREATRHSYGSSPKITFLSQAVIQRARITLGYISVTDVDNVVRVMAREVREELEDLLKAEVGL